MKRPQYVFRPQLSIPDHRRAWTLLQQILREVIREELARGVVIQEPLKPTAEKEVPKQTLDFLASLCD